VLTRLIKMPKLNPDHSLPNFTAYSLSRAFFSYGLGLEDENRNNSVFLIMQKVKENSHYFIKNLI